MIRWTAYSRTFPILVGVVTGVIASTVLPVMAYATGVWS